METKVFNQVIQSIQSISELFPQEPSIAIANNQQYLMYKPSKFLDLKITPGQELKKGSIAHKTLHEKSKVMSHVPAKLFGVPYFGMGIPIFDDQGQPMGAITFQLPPEQAQPFQLLPRHEFIIGQDEERFIPVHFEKVAFFASDEGQTFMYTSNEKFRVRQTLQELEYGLPTNRFIRCHRAFLINVSYIKEIQRDFHSTFLLIMNDKEQTRIPVSQKYASSFRRALGF